MPCSSNSDADDLRSMLAVSCCPDSSASSSAVADPPRSDDSDAECLRLAPASIRSCVTVQSLGFRIPGYGSRATGYRLWNVGCGQGIM